ncbi:MAG: hypothetical protein ABI550_09225 [Ignavibacteriaceae bacterium]
MFDKEIKFITDFSLNKIKKLGSFFTFEKLLSSNIHPAILQYINSELDYLIYQDRNKLLQKSVFDYSGSEISKYFNSIGNEIKKNKKVSYEDIKKLVAQAVSFNINFTFRPKWSLIKLIYEGSEIKTVEEIKLMLGYIYYYDYIKNIFNQYLLKKKIHSLSLVEFEVILNKIDDAVFVTQSVDIIDNALFSIADFHNIGGINKTKVSINSFEIFLKVKNLIDQLLRIRKSFSSESKQKFDIDDIRLALYSPQPYEINDSEDIEEEKLLDEITGSEIQEGESSENEEKMGEFEENEIENIDMEDPKKDETILTSEKEIEEFKENKIADDNKINDKINDEINDEIQKELNEELMKIDIDDETEEDSILSEFNEELKSFEEDEIVIESDEDEVQFDISEKEHLDSLYDFEEEKNQDEADIEQAEDEEENVNSFDEIEDEELMSENLIEEQNEPEISEDDFEELNRIKQELDELDKNDLYTQTEEFENEKDIDNENIENEDIENIEAGEDQESENQKAIKKGKDFFNFLSAKEIDKIVNSIFNEDRTDFANSMEKISECNDYEEATEILKDLFLTYHINPYAKEAVLLTNAVSNYFNQA